MSPSLKHLSRDELLIQCERLAKELEHTKLERDDFERDVELLSLQVGNATFDTSSVLQERVRSAESELARLRIESRKIGDENRGHLEDIVQLKQAKRVSDKSCREAHERCTRLEADLRFYKDQNAANMMDRDRAQGDAEALRDANSHLETSLRAAERDLDAARQRSTELEARARRQDTEIAGLRERAAAAARVPELEAELARRADALRGSTAERDRLRADLEEAQAAASAQQEALRTTEARLTHALCAQEAVENELANAQGRLDELERDKEAQDQQMAGLQRRCDNDASSIANLRTQLSEAEQRIRNELQREIQEAEGRLEVERKTTAALQARLDETAARCESVSVELAAAGTHRTEVEAQLETAEALAAELQTKLGQVTQEKIQLLVEVADLKEALRDTTSADRTEEDSWGGWPWKPTFARSARPSNSQTPSKSANNSRAVRETGDVSDVDGSQRASAAGSIDTSVARSVTASPVKTPPPR